MTKKIILIVLTFAIYSFTYGQKNQSFLIKIPSLDYIPAVSHDNQGNLIGNTRTGNSIIDGLINSYEIYNVIEAFPLSKRPSLKNFYRIECNDSSLLDKMLKFKHVYPLGEFLNYELLYTPNDFGTVGGYILDDQEELNYVGAKDAWDITRGADNIIIGVSDTNYHPNHVDIRQTIETVYGTNYPEGDSQHGAAVSIIAAGNTNNYGLGMAAIGHDSYIYHAKGLGDTQNEFLSELYGVKVINSSWGSGSSNPPSENSTIQEKYDEIVNDRKVVVVAAAGNGNNKPNSNADPTRYYRPASYRGVIAVSSIGHTDKSWDNGFWSMNEDYHLRFRGGEWVSHQHNDSIDIVAPGYGILLGYAEDTFARHGQGTSFAAPMVSGTVALMFDVNYCIDPKEVETILKLTAVKIDHLPQNIQFYGKLGAGKLDAYGAVKMADDMAQPFGTVEVKDRILYRPWFYKLVTAPYEIKMTNNDVSQGSKLKFRARNNIEILSGSYMPDTGGYIDLQIDENLPLNDCPPPPQTSKYKYQNQQLEKINNHFDVYPTLVKSDINIVAINKFVDNNYSLKLFNFFGREVLSESNLIDERKVLDLSKLVTGMYILKIYDKSGRELQSHKLVKQ